MRLIGFPDQHGFGQNLVALNVPAGLAPVD